MTDVQVVKDLDRALAGTAAIVAGIRADQWPAPTPCTELDVRGVLNHLVRGNLLFDAIVRDEPRPAPGTDHLGDDPSRGSLRRRSPGLARRARRGSSRRVPRPAGVTP